MSNLIVDYTLDRTTVANPDGTLAAIVDGCAVVPGPGPTSLGAFASALSLVPDGSIQTIVPPGLLRTDQLCARIVIAPPAALASPQTLLACTLIPLSIRIEPAASPADFNAVVTIQNAAAGADDASTRDRRPLSLGAPHVIDLVYDLDTLAVLVDGQVLAVTAFPDGALAAGSGDRLFLGTAADGRSERFQGAIAAFQLHAGIPMDLEALVDAARTSPEWHIRRKLNRVRTTIPLGNPRGDIQWDASLSAHVQLFDRGSIQYVPSLGGAYVLEGETWERYRDPAIHTRLGHATNDEVNARAPGCRKTVFERGAIYRTPSGSAAVFDRIFHRYEALNETAGALGLPVDGTPMVPGGYFQVFEHGLIYYEIGREWAAGITGDLAASYRAQGGPDILGFPRTGEYPIEKGGNVLGRAIELERGAIYASPATGMFAVHGAIRTEYQSRGGPLSDLGFPTAQERAVPGDPMARYSTFQHGIIVGFGGTAVTCTPFQIYLGRLETDDADNVGDDGVGDSDLYFSCRLTQNGTTVFDQRFPPDAPHYPESNSANVDQQLAPVFSPDPALSVVLDLQVMESDLTNDDDLGTYTETLSLANAWGRRPSPDGLRDTGRFGAVRSFSWAVRSVTSNAAPLDFWGVRNRGTPVITQAQFGAAFRNVDSDPEWYDPSDWINQILYELAIKGLANGGNCFGMSLEAIFAWKGRSLFARPLASYTSWSRVVNEINIRHMYQASAEAIWWLVGEFVRGHTHDPVNVFQETRACAERGDTAVLCLAQNADFSGAPHCILPVAWDTSSKPWRMKIHDPNFGNTLRDLLVDPDTNRFTYAGSSTYTGEGSDGGRLFYFPFSLFSERPRTPDYELLLLLIAGIILFVGDAGETVGLTEPGGASLDGTSGVPEQREEREEKFYRFRGLYGDDPVGVDLFFHRDPGRLVLPPDPDHPSPLTAPPPPPRPVSFVHALRGRKAAPLTYAWKHGLASFTVTTPIEVGEPFTVEATALGTDTASMQVTTVRPKSITLQVGGRLGAGAGSLRITVEGVQALPARPLRLAERPGHGSLDITGAAPGTVTVKLEALSGTTKVERTFDVPFTGDMRLVLLPSRDYAQLKVGDIPALGGPLQRGRILDAR